MGDELIAVYPSRDTFESSDYARCLIFYDWEKPVGSDWLSLVEAFFSEFGQEPFEATANLGDQRSHGRFSRTKKKLARLLESKGNQASLNIRIRGEARSESFFPCDVEISLTTRPSGQKEGLIAIRQNLVESCVALVARLGKNLFDATGEVYAGAFDFPTVFGPAAYWASLGTIPSGGSSLANKEYLERLTRWRDNRWNGVMTKDGYLREVYPINYVLESHLNMPFRGASLGAHMERVGVLKVSECSSKMFRWLIPVERLPWVRSELESSGLILSASEVQSREE